MTKPLPFIPNSTQTPDIVFDYWMAKLNGSQFKVLCYIVRRTYGFRKFADSISIDQIQHGIRRADGSVLDYGTGIASSTTVTNAIKALEEDHELIVVHRSTNDDGSHNVNTYSINLDKVYPRGWNPLDVDDLEGLSNNWGTPLLQKLGEGSPKTGDTTYSGQDTGNPSPAVPAEGDPADPPDDKPARPLTKHQQITGSLARADGVPDGSPHKAYGLAMRLAKALISAWPTTTPEEVELFTTVWYPKTYPGMNFVRAEDKLLSEYAKFWAAYSTGQVQRAVTPTDPLNDPRNLAHYEFS